MEMTFSCTPLLMNIGSFFYGTRMLFPYFPRSSSVYVVLLTAFALIPSPLAAQLTVPASAALDGNGDGAPDPLPATRGQGLCTQFTRAQTPPQVRVFSFPAARNLLNGTNDPLWQRYNPDLTFFSILPVLDLQDGFDATTGGQSPLNPLFPWSDPDNSLTSASCESHGGPVGADYFVARFRGYVRIPTAGVYTFALRYDDGVSLRIGNVAIYSDDAPAPVRLATRRVDFASAGLYPIEIEYFEVIRQAQLEVFMASGAITFTNGAPLTIATPPSSGSNLSAVSGTLVLPEVFKLLDQNSLYLPVDAPNCGELVGQPSDRCVLADPAYTAGNGIVELRSGGGAETCDDGNQTSGDGCENDATLTPGYVCRGQLSVCAVDTDGEGVSDEEEIANGTDPLVAASEGAVSDPEPANAASDKEGGCSIHHGARASTSALAGLLGLMLALVWRGRRRRG